MVTRRRAVAFSILVLLGSASVFCGAYQRPVANGAAPATNSTPTLNGIVQAVKQRQAENHAEARPYSIVREYRLFGSEAAEDPDSVVVVRVQHLGPGQTQYSILQSSGSSRGVSIVHRVLENESEIHKDPQSYGLSPENYNFVYEGEQEVDGHRCHLLALQPKRKDHLLIDGRAWIDAESFQIRLIQGEPSKSPSWWLKKVELTMRYGDIGGVWAPVSTQAIADVRWFGKRVFTSRELSGSVGATVATTRREPGNPVSRTGAPSVRKHVVSRPAAVLGVDVPQL